MKKKQKQPFPLRMDAEVEVRVRKAAKEDRRSINTWLQIAAEEKLMRDARQEVLA